MMDNFTLLSLVVFGGIRDIKTTISGGGTGGGGTGSGVVSVERYSDLDASAIEGTKVFVNKPSGASFLGSGTRYPAGWYIKRTAGWEKTGDYATSRGELQDERLEEATLKLTATDNNNNIKYALFTTANNYFVRDVQESKDAYKENASNTALMDTEANAWTNRASLTFEAIEKSKWAI